jgi:uncharacterized membrane protein (DUF106 family)
MKAANKRVHSVRTGIPSGQTNIQSFGIQGQVIHVLYDQLGDPYYEMTLSDVPIIQLNCLDHIGSSDILGRLSLSLVNGGSSGAAVQAECNLRVQDMSLNLTYIKNNQAPGKQFNLESYATIVGHLYRAYLRPTQAQLTDESLQAASDVTLTERTFEINKYTPSEAGQVVYQHIEAHGEYTIALHIDQSYASFFTVFTQNYQFQNSFQPRDGVKAFDFGILSGGRAIIAYSTAKVSGNNVKFIIIKGADKITEDVTFGDYTKIRFALIGTDKFAVTGLQSNGTLDLMIVTVTQTISVQRIGSPLNSVTDFDTSNEGIYFSIWYLNPESTELQQLQYQKTKLQSQPVSWSYIIQIDHYFWLNTVSCEVDSASTVICVVNSLSTMIFEVSVDFTGTMPSPSVYANQKFGNYDGAFIYTNENYFVQRAVTSRVPRNYAFLIWKRMSKGGSGKLYYAIQIEGNATPGTDVNSGFTPFTLITDLNGNSVVVAGSHNPLNPVEFHQIGQFQITVNEDNIDLSKVMMEFIGLGVGNYESSIQTILDGGSVTPIEPAVSWWPFALGAAVLIAIVIIVYFVFLQKKSEANPSVGAGNADAYRSLKPDEEAGEKPSAQGEDYVLRKPDN